VSYLRAGLLERPNAVVWSPDLDSGRFSLLSAEPGDLLGSWVEAEAQPSSETAGLDATHRAHILQLAREVATDGRTRRYEHEVQLTGGRRVWVRTELQRVSQGLTRPLALLGASFDITELKLAAAALERAERRLSAILDSAPLAIFVVDRQSRILESRGLALEAFQPASGDLLSLSSLGLNQQAPWIPEALERTLAGEDFRWSGPMSGRYLEVHCVPLREDSLIIGLIGVAVDITERKRAQEELRHSRDQLRALLREAPVGITVLSGDGRRLYCNPEAARITGYSSAEAMLAAPRAELAERLLALDGEEHPFPVEAHPSARAIAGEERPSLLVHYRVRNTGEDFYVRLTSRAVRGDRGRVRFVINTWQDVTPLKRAEEELRFQHSLLEAQSEATTEGILVVSPDRRMLSFNQRFAEMWSIPGEVQLSRSEEEALRWIHEKLQDPTDFRARVEFLYAHPEVRSHDEIALRDGRTWERHSMPLRGPEGHPYYGRVWFYRDITARKQSELRERMFLLEQTARTLAEAAMQRASFLADASRVLSTSLDHHAIVAALARRCVPYLADWCVVDLFEPDEVVHRAAVAHADPIKDELAQQLSRIVPDLGEAEGVGRVLRTGQPDIRVQVTPEMRMSGPREWAPVSAREPEMLEVVRQLGMESVMTLPLAVRGRVLGAITFVLGEGVRRYGSLEREVAEDLAGRVAMAVENARLYQQAQQAVILRDEFLSIAAHELRTPLTALELATRALQRVGHKYLVGERAFGEALTATQRQTVRLEKLVESLLDVSRIQSGKLQMELEPLDLGAVVRAIVARMGDLAQQAGSEVSVSASESVMGRWDRSLIEQVVANLLENAVKYGAGRPIGLQVVREKGYAVLTVSDQGIGIPQGEQERIFGRFERAVSAAHYGGLGLGLFIVRRAVERLGGHVSVWSSPGQGATFTVSLPLEPPLAHADGGGAP